MEISCKNCGSKGCIKNGKVRNQQRYKCKTCMHNFVEGDKREKVSPEAKALAALLYNSGKASYGFIAKLFYVSRTAVLKWIRSIAHRLPEPQNDIEIKEIDIDNISHFLEEKINIHKNGKPWIVVETKPADGLLAIVLIKPLKG